MSRADVNSPLLGHHADPVAREGTTGYCRAWPKAITVAQFGIWMLMAIVWVAVFTHHLIPWSTHPLFTSLGVLLFAQAILIPPTKYPQDSITHGLFIRLAYRNMTLILSGLASFAIGFSVMEYDKVHHGGVHLGNAHAIFGVLAYAFVILQSLVAFVQYIFPNWFLGGFDSRVAQRVHKIVGFIAFLVALMALVTATQHDYNKRITQIPTWTILLASGFSVCGIILLF